VAVESGAKVIYLQSHPLWAAAQRRERQLQEAMHRHPASAPRQRAAFGGSGGPAARSARRYQSANEPA
jgi:hypothetical protein